MQLAVTYFPIWYVWFLSVCQTTRLTSSDRFLSSFSTSTTLSNAQNDPGKLLHLFSTLSLLTACTQTLYKLVHISNMRFGSKLVPWPWCMSMLIMSRVLCLVVDRHYLCVRRSIEDSIIPSSLCNKVCLDLMSSWSLLTFVKFITRIASSLHVWEECYSAQYVPFDRILPVTITDHFIRCTEHPSEASGRYVTLLSIHQHCPWRSPVSRHSEQYVNFRRTRGTPTMSRMLRTVHGM